MSLHRDSDALVWEAVVEGYSWPQSVRQGETVNLHCSARCDSVRVTIRRIGADSIVFLDRDGVTVPASPVPDQVWANGCDWPVTLAIDTDDSWAPGFYEVTFAAEDAPRGHISRSHAFFIIRPAVGARNQARILLGLSTSTYNAYNNWGGSCYYMNGATEVSFERPLARGFLARRDAPSVRVARVHEDFDRPQLIEYIAQEGISHLSLAGGWFNWERRFVTWAERAGYTVDLATSLDLHQDSDVLAAYRLFVSVGHDEYWSWEMRDRVEDFVAAGGNAAFFSGNTAYWQIRYSGPANGKMICYKYRARELDPIASQSDQSRLTSIWSDTRIGRPENHLTGVSFTRGGYIRSGGGVRRGGGGYIVARGDHWAFDGTELRYGDSFGSRHFVAAYEADGCELTLENGLPTATGANGTPADFTVLATSPAHLWSHTSGYSEFPPVVQIGDDDPGDLEYSSICLFGDASAENVAKITNGNAVMGIFHRGGAVFTSGCTDWAYGLDASWDPGLDGPDPDVDRITRNVLDRIG